MPIAKIIVRQQIALLVATWALFAIGCEHSTSHNDPPTTATPKGTIHIERIQEAEAVLAQLGRMSWVFKHRGGELTTEFTIYHRRAGKDHTQQVIFRSLGDQAVHVLHSQTDADGQHDEEGGYVVIAFPEPVKRDGGNITHSFSLNGATCSQTESARDVYPKTVFSHSHSIKFYGERPSDKPVELRPGDRKVLVDYSVQRSSAGTDLPQNEREMVRYVLTITALKDGQLPKPESTVTK